MKPIITLDPTAAGNCLTDEEIDALASGKAKLRTLFLKHETLRTLRLNADERERFESVKVRGFCDEWSDSDKVCVLAYRWLETHRLPNVHVERRGKFAKVKMDLLRVEKAQRDRWGTIAAQDPPAVIGGRYRYWGDYVIVERVPKESGAACAEWLVTLFRAAVTRELVG